MRKPANQALLIAAICIVAAVGGFAVYRHLAQPTVIDQPGGQAPEIKIADLTGAPRSLSEWRGKLLLVNFWATWCGPCLHEIPMLIETQARYGERGLQIVGAAMDEVDAVRNGAPQLGITYPVLVGDTEIVNAMQALGDELGALPYSVLIDASGQIVLRKHGEFQAAELQALVEAHLPKAGS